MRKKLIAVLSCVLILLFCISAMVACKECDHNFVNGECTKCHEKDPNYVEECDHHFVDGVCTKCGETDPNYVAPKKDYDMSGVKFENKTVVYNGKNQTMAISGALPQGVTVAYTYYSDDKYTTKVTEAILPGTYYVVASFKGAAEGYNPIADMKATLTINKNDYDMSGVKFENKIAQYTGEEIELTITGTLPQGVTVTYVYATDSAFTDIVTEMVEAGTYYVKATFTGEVGYHDIDDMTATLTISKLSFVANLSFTDKEVNYNGEAHGIEVTGDIPEVATIAYKFFTDEACTNEVTEMINAGVYYVQATVAEKDNEENKEVLKAKLTIKKIDVEAIAFKGGEVEYDGEEHTIAITGELPQGATAVEYKYYTDEACTAEVDEMINAGVYYVKASFTVDANHNDVQARVATLTITKKAVDVTFANKSVDYDGEAQTNTIAEEDLPEEIEGVTYKYYSDIACTIEVAEANVINPATYFVVATFTTDGNHVAESKMSTLTINKIAFDNFDDSTAEFTIKGSYESNETLATIENGAYTFEYTPGRAYEITATVTDVNGLAPTVEFFRDSNLTDQISGLSKPGLANYGDKIYVRATYSDDLHIATVVKTIKLRKHVIELKTFDDLKLMREHIYGNTEKGTAAISIAERRGYRYVLANDIDCEGQLWTPITYVMEWGESAMDLLKHTFCSEFDGNGHTISNYRITHESINVADIPTTGSITNTIHVGFFGRVNNGIMYGGESLNKQELEEQACNIHDVKFSNVTIKFDAKDPDYTLGETKIVAGIVIGYTDTGNQHTFGRTNLYNITVENCTIDIDAYETFVGGIIGEEHLAHNNAGLRYNLKVKDCNFYAISSHSGSVRVYIGGLVGRWHCEPSGTPDSLTGSIFGGPTYGTRYLNCSVENIKLGYNYEKIIELFGDEVTRLNDESYWEADDKIVAAQEKLEKATTEAERAEAQAELEAAEAEMESVMQALRDLRTQQMAYINKMGGNIYAGLFFGSAEPGPTASGFYGVNAIGFKNCSASNYLIAHTSPADPDTRITWYTGFIGYLSSGVNMIIIDTEHSNDKDWNDGANGVYGLPADEWAIIDQQEMDERKLKTTGEEWCSDITTAEEDFALRYLGLID